MRDHWDRWGWIVAVGVFSVVLLRAVWGRPAFCGPETEQCFREWVAALGGWAAVAAAVPTVIFLAKQISNADRYQRDNMNLQYLRTRTLAKKVIKTAKKLQRGIEERQAHWSAIDFDNITSLHPGYIIQMVSELEALMPFHVFERFEDEIDVPNGVDVSFLRVRIANTHSYVESRRKMRKHIFGHRDRNELFLTYKYAFDYARACIEAAQDHIDRTDEIISRKL